jgi:hypothetical protein
MVEPNPHGFEAVAVPRGEAPRRRLDADRILGHDGPVLANPLSERCVDSRVVAVDAAPEDRDGRANGFALIAEVRARYAAGATLSELAMKTALPYATIKFYVSAAGYKRRPAVAVDEQAALF